MRVYLRSLFLFILFSPFMCALAEPDTAAGLPRENLALGIGKDLLCQSTDIHDRAGDPEDDNFLKMAGAIITIVDDPYFNQFRYSFVEPLKVGMSYLYSAQQLVGEGGVIFIAEVAGDLPAFVSEIKASPAKEDDDFLSVSNVLFYKTLKEKMSPDSEPEFTKIVIGQNRIQKIQGRFFYGCIQTMDLG